MLFLLSTQLLHVWAISLQLSLCFKAISRFKSCQAERRMSYVGCLVLNSLAFQHRELDEGQNCSPRMLETLEGALWVFERA
jgi:hypothetical protein